MIVKTLFFIFLKKGEESIQDQRKRLLPLCRKFPHPEKESILKYLYGGTVLTNFWGRSTDIFDSRMPHIPLGQYVFTDGKWKWNGELPYYVEHYNIELPPKFLTYMKKNNWLVRDDLPKSLMILPIKAIYL